MVFAILLAQKRALSPVKMSADFFMFVTHSIFFCIKSIFIFPLVSSFSTYISDNVKENRQYIFIFSKCSKSFTNNIVTIYCHIFSTIFPKYLQNIVKRNDHICKYWESLVNNFVIICNYYLLFILIFNYMFLTTFTYIWRRFEVLGWFVRIL